VNAGHKRALTYLLGFAIPALLPALIRGEYYLHMLIMMLFYGYCAYAWNFIAMAGQLSLSHGAFVGLGGYISTMLLIRYGLSPWLGLLLSGLGCVVVSLAIGLPSLRLRGPYFALMTVAFATILKIYFENTQRLWGIDIRGSAGLLVPVIRDNPYLMSFGSKSYYYWTILALVIAVMYLTETLERTRLGLYLAAIRSNENAAESLGINITVYKMAAFLVGAFLAGVGGTFYAQYVRIVSPSRVFGIDLSVEIAMLGIVGGRATLLGPLLGSLILTPAGEITRMLFGGSYLGVHLIFYGVVIAVAILYFPKGLNEPFRNLLGNLRGYLGLRDTIRREEAR